MCWNLHKISLLMRSIWYSDKLSIQKNSGKVCYESCEATGNVSKKYWVFLVCHDLLVIFLCWCVIYYISWPQWPCACMYVCVCLYVCLSVCVLLLWTPCMFHSLLFLRVINLLCIQSTKNRRFAIEEQFKCMSWWFWHKLQCELRLCDESSEQEMDAINNSLFCVIVELYTKRNLHD